MKRKKSTNTPSIASLWGGRREKLNHKIYQISLWYLMLLGKYGSTHNFQNLKIANQIANNVFKN